MEPSSLLDGRPGACWRHAERRRFTQHPQQHAELVVLHGLSGETQYLIDGNIVTLRAGPVLFAFAGQAHLPLSESPDFDMWVFLISGEILRPGSQQQGPPPPHVGEFNGTTGPRVLRSTQSAELEAAACDPQRPLT